MPKIRVHKIYDSAKYGQHYFSIVTENSNEYRKS